MNTPIYQLMGHLHTPGNDPRLVLLSQTIEPGTHIMLLQPKDSNHLYYRIPVNGEYLPYKGSPGHITDVQFLPCPTL